MKQVTTPPFGSEVTITIGEFQLDGPTPFGGDVTIRRLKSNGWSKEPVCTHAQHLCDSRSELRLKRKHAESIERKIR